jgi:hypothetical protein
LEPQLQSKWEAAMATHNLPLHTFRQAELRMHAPKPAPESRAGHVHTAMEFEFRRRVIALSTANSTI